MGGLVRVKVSHMLVSVIVLLALSLANLGLSVFGSFQQGDIIRGQKVIEERVTPLCLSNQTVEACKRQIDSAKRSVVVRLCGIVHERLGLPRGECENALAAVVKRNAAASADGSRSSRGPPSSGATGPGKSGVGSIPGGSGHEAGPNRPPPGTGTRQSPPPQQQSGGGGGSAGPQTPNGNQGQGQGAGSVEAEGKGSAAGAQIEVEAEVKVPSLEVPAIVPKAVESVTGAADEVGSGVKGALGQ